MNTLRGHISLKMAVLQNSQNFISRSPVPGTKKIANSLFSSLLAIFAFNIVPKMFPQGQGN